VLRIGGEVIVCVVISAPMMPQSGTRSPMPALKKYFSALSSSLNQLPETAQKKA
jgi:hypothetical protein